MSRRNVNSPIYIVMHHSLTKDSETVSWEAIRRYHTETLGWSDIGYHRGVEIVGEYPVLMQGRKLFEAGAHVREGGFNRTSIGYCIVGNFDVMAPPPSVWARALNAVSTDCRRFGIPSGHVLGHREAQAMAGVPEGERKSCPGRMFDMDKFRRDLDRLGRQPVTV